MGVLLLIAGLVLLFAGSSWFAAASTVGLILSIAGGVVLTVEAIWFLFVAGKVNKTFKAMDSGSPFR